MKRSFRRFIIYLLLITLTLSFFYVRRINKLKPPEEYPVDTFIRNVDNKVALVFTAHEEDIACVAGTLAEMIKNGWHITHLCFSSHDAETDSLYKLNARAFGISSVVLMEFPYRFDLDTNQAPEDPFKSDIFPAVYAYDTILKTLGKQMVSLNPSILFSFEDRYGLNGNVDHVMVSRMLTNYCLQHRQDWEYNVQCNYQVAFPPTFAQKLLADDDEDEFTTFEKAMRLYGTFRYPKPDLCFDIRKNGEAKMKFLMSFPESSRKNILELVPHYHQYPWWIYTRVFSREYFRLSCM